MAWETKNSIKEYMIDHWGEKFFSVSEKGVMCANPFADEKRISFEEVIEEIKERDIKFPVVIRFHDILISRVKSLFQKFNHAMEENKYKGHYHGVYPIKVNQMREVVEEITDAGEKLFLGLEAGSKSELLAILSYRLSKNAIYILNGYKDPEYLKLAHMGIRMGKKMIIVLEKFSELQNTIQISKDLGIEPIIGIRVKLESKGGGRWAESSGTKAKFGFTMNEVLKAKQLLSENNMLHTLNLLHFHIGSQVPNISTIKDATTEATRIYANLVQDGVPLQFLDIGGGLGVNYEGALGSSETAVNYKAEDYIDSVISAIKNICDEEEVDHPDIISESGRFITAHHSCIITNVIGSTKSAIEQLPESIHIKSNSSPKQLIEMTEIEADITEDNYQQNYFLAENTLEDSLVSFKEGNITLKEKAAINQIYHDIVQKILKLNLDTEIYKNFIQKLDHEMSPQYICNFSVFQSTPDCWGVDQILPVVPIFYHTEEPSEKVTLVDITCDSDGKLDQFLSINGKRNFVQMHNLKEKDEYYIGIFLTGAYQDVMGDMHNLFGRLNEVHIYFDDEDDKNFYIEEHIKGQSTGAVLSTMQYNPETMADRVKLVIDHQIKRGKIKAREGVAWIDYYESCLESYTYMC